MSPEKRNLIDMVKQGATAKTTQGAINFNDTITGGVNGNTNCKIYYNRRTDDWSRPNGPHMMDCPNCGRRVSRQAHQCPGCGHPIAWELKKKRPARP